MTPSIIAVSAISSLNKYRAIKKNIQININQIKLNAQTAYSLYYF